MTDDTFHAEAILEWEFEYARETAAQAQNDRTTIVNMYLLLVGGVGSLAVALPQLGLTPSFNVPRGAYALLFGLIALVGFFTLMKLVRLRQAWHDSVCAMNTIKHFYLQRFPELQDAFRWKMETIPAPGKLWTITFNLALLVVLVDSVALATAIYLTGLRVAIGDYVVEAFAALLFFFWQAWWYFYQLAPAEKDTG